MVDVSLLARPEEMADFNPFGLAFRENPMPFHTRLLVASPGLITMEGIPSVFVARYDQCAAVLRDFRGFSSEKPAGLPGMERIDFFNGLPVMNYSDPPDHMRRRKIVNPAFAPHRTLELARSADSLIGMMLDDAAARGTFDAVSELAKPLAIRILLHDFLGITEEHAHIFLNYVATIPLLDALRPGDPKPAPYLHAWEAGRQFCREQQDLARRGLCRNLIGVIAEGADSGAITDDEMMAMMIVLLIGGVSTMAGAAAAALMLLAQHPHAAARIRADPDLAHQHLEEALRLEPPVSLVMRFAAGGARIGERRLTAGTPVYVMIAVACHDPAAFPDPYSYNLDRDNANTHLAFGHGIHTCIGNSITRSLVPLLIQKTVARFNTLRIAATADPIQYDYATPRARHLKRLMLTV
jgi:cytochrome P450